MTEALQMIRETLGDDAIIVASNEERGERSGVRVTAAVEPAFELNRGGAASKNDWLQYDEEQEENIIAEHVTDIMIRHSVPEDVMDNILSCVSVLDFEDPLTALAAAIEELYRFAPIPTTSHNQPLMMVGPPGSGKTLAVAKIAARSVMNGLNVGVLSTDTVRAGGIEQLQAFTKLLDVPLEKASSPQGLMHGCNEFMYESDQIIIDSAGINPFDPNDLKTLAKMIETVNAQAILVMPAGVESEEAAETARLFSSIGVTHLLPTRVDIARRMGNLLAAAHQGDLVFCDVSNTPKVAQGLIPLSPRTLARLLIPDYRKSQASDRLTPQAARQTQRKRYME